MNYLEDNKILDENQRSKTGRQYIYITGIVFGKETWKKTNLSRIFKYVESSPDRVWETEYSIYYGNMI